MTQHIDNLQYYILWIRQKKIPIFMHHTVLSGFSFQFFLAFYWLFPLISIRKCFHELSIGRQSISFKSYGASNIIYCWMCVLWSMCFVVYRNIYLTNLRVLNPSGNGERNSFCGRLNLCRTCFGWLLKNVMNVEAISWW